MRVSSCARGSPFKKSPSFSQLRLDKPLSLWYNTSMKVKKQCEACENDILFSDDTTRFCYTCTEEFEDTLDAPKLTDAELDDWAKRCGAEQWYYND